MSLRRVLASLAILYILSPVAVADDQKPSQISSENPLQAQIDATPENGVLKPAPGIYQGSLRITKPITIDGQGQVTIDGGGKGTVIVLETHDSVLRGLKVIGSGGSHDQEDTGINIRGDRNVVEDNAIDDCLFGIDLRQANKNIVRRNSIRSKNNELGVRGDAVRLWYSMDNEVVENRITRSRDLVVWYSNGNHIARNYSVGNRYSVHFMFARENTVEGNYFYDNSVGVYLMYTQGVKVKNNLISHSTGATGLGIGFKESSDSVIEGNSVIYCATGIGFDLSPFEPGSKITITKNRIAYNALGIHFLSDREGIDITDNIFEGNISHAMSGSGHGVHEGINWKHNYWDTYQGFDRDNDGIGDTPFELYTYFDEIWSEIPEARFFKNSPFMEIIDFLERLAPFSSPNLLLRDSEPVFDRPKDKAYEERERFPRPA